MAPGPSVATVVDMSSIEADEWDRCMTGDAEGHAYYLAATHGSAQRAVAVRRDGRLVGCVPVQTIAFPLALARQSQRPRLAAVTRLVQPKIRVLLAGSPLADRCHAGYAPDLSESARKDVARSLVRAFEDEARRVGNWVVAFKDVDVATESWLGPVLQERGFCPVSSLPVAALHVRGKTIDDYMRGLSSATRSDLRRKWRRRDRLRPEDRERVDDITDQLDELYESTRAASAVAYGEFERLPRGYFAHVGRALNGRALFRLYWAGGTLAAFNLLLLQHDRVIDKFLGMRYPLARDYDLYAISWLRNVELCQRLGIAVLQTGQTCYREKLRLGSTLLRSTNFFKHRQPLVHALLARASSAFAFDRGDPELAGRGVVR